MVLSETKKAILSRLKQDILQWEGYVPPAAVAEDQVGLPAVEAAFPNAIFPRAAIHEFLTPTAEQYAASGGFITGILKKLMGNGRACVWISAGRTIFPPALKEFGIEPDRVIFVDLHRDRDVLWAMEEGLKCEDLAAVVGEIRSVNFAQSRRLQLAVEKSRTTGFLLRTDDGALRSTACAARWNISAIPSMPSHGLPGVGHPRWQVELLKVRNGNPGKWTVEWHADRFLELPFEAAEENLGRDNYVQKIG